MTLPVLFFGKHSEKEGAIRVTQDGSAWLMLNGTWRNITAEYSSYKNAKTRCENARRKNFKNYGGRGIYFRFVSFPQFLEQIGLKPSPELTLDRINNDGHYEPGNVRWATVTEQNHNQRPHAS